MSEQEDPGATEEWKAKWGRIPADSRDQVVTFLSVQDNLIGLNVARTTKKDGLRDELIKSYDKAVIPAFHYYPFTDENDFQDLRRVLKMGIDLQGLTIRLKANKKDGLKEVMEPNKILWELVFSKLSVKTKQGSCDSYAATVTLISTLSLFAREDTPTVARLAPTPAGSHAFHSLSKPLNSRRSVRNTGPGAGMCVCGCRRGRGGRTNGMER